MKHTFKRITPPPLIIAVLLLTAAILLACGPATQAEPGEQPDSQTNTQDSEPEPTATPTPEPTPEPPKYPNLDATLQEIVARFEAEELSESAAAAQAHTYHGSSVLVRVDFSANIDAVDTWMEGKDISQRNVNATHIPPNINAFVKVSLLGALSQQEGVIQVKETIPPWVDLPSGQDSGGASGAGGASGSTGAEGPSGDAAGPRLPLWLKGHPYHKLDSELTGLVDLYERGELTEAEAAAQTEDYQGSAVGVEVELISDPANTDAVVAWLASRGVSAGYIFKDETSGPAPHRRLRPGVHAGGPLQADWGCQDICPETSQSAERERLRVAARAAVRRSGAGVRAHSHASANRGQPRGRGPPRPHIASLYSTGCVASINPPTNLSLSLN